MLLGARELRVLEQALSGSAVNSDVDTLDVAGLLRTQEGSHRRYVFRFAESAYALLGHELLLELVSRHSGGRSAVFEHRFHSIGQRWAGENRVHRDPIFHAEARQTLAEVRHRRIDRTADHCVGCGGASEATVDVEY